MLMSRDFYLDRAAEARADAEAATLVHARERSLAAEAAWLGMAERVARLERRRARNVMPVAE
jgi:hypothetical protein